jgi:adenosine kinase
MPEGSSKVEIAKNLAAFEKVGSRPRIAILTNGPAPTIVATGSLDGGEVTVVEYPVPALAAGELLDTNGAGDSFVGAFLAEYYLDKSIADCVKAGTLLSTEVVKRSGCTFPETITE